MKKPQRILLFAMWFGAVGGVALAARADMELRNPPSLPTVVQVGFYLSDINDVNEQQETFEFEGRLISTWRDRTACSHIYC